MNGGRKSSTFFDGQRLSDGHDATHKQTGPSQETSTRKAHTAKGTTRRQIIIADYTEEIDALYATAKTESLSHISAPKAWTHEEILPYIRQIVTTVLHEEAPDGVDIFQYGCDRYGVLVNHRCLML